MAHMGCKCGNDLWDGTGEIVFDVFSTEDLKNYMIKNGDKTWDELYNEYTAITEDNSYFWFCDNCKRVHLWTYVPEYCSRTYSVSENTENIVPEDLNELKEYLIFNLNDNIDDKKISELLLSNPIRPYKYLVTKDLRYAFVYNFETEKIETVYQLDDEDYNEYNIDTKSKDDTLIYNITTTNKGKKFKYINGEKIEVDVDDHPITQINHMVDVNGVGMADITKTEIYDKDMKSMRSEKQIFIYEKNGNLSDIKNIDEDNLSGIHGMMTKCTLINGECEIGFSDVYDCKNKKHYNGTVYDYITLWTWDNLDEDKHELIGNDESKYNQTFKKVYIKDMQKVECILYSNPRWGGRLTNKFEFSNKGKENNVELEIPEFLKDKKTNKNNQYFYNRIICSEDATKDIEKNKVFDKKDYRLDKYSKNIYELKFNTKELYFKEIGNFITKHKDSKWYYIDESENRQGFYSYDNNVLKLDTRSIENKNKYTRLEFIKYDTYSYNPYFHILFDVSESLIIIEDFDLFKKFEYSMSKDDIEIINALTEKYATAYCDNNVVIPSSNEREKEKFLFNYLGRTITLNSTSIETDSSCEFIDFLSKMDIHNTINTIFLKYDLPEKYFVTMNKYDKKGDSYRIKKKYNEIANNNNGKYKYVYIEYEDAIGDRMYCYLDNGLELNKGDRVLVERRNENATGRVITIKEYSIEEVPYPVSSMKSIIKKIDDDFEIDEFIDYNYYEDDID